MPVRELKLSLDLSALREALSLTEEQLPDDATDDQINELLAASKAGGPSSEKKDDKKDGNALVPNQDKPEPNDDKPDPNRARTPQQVPGGLVVDADMWAQTQEELRVVRADREKRERNEDAEFIRKAVRAGKFPGARADHYMTLMQADRDGTRKFIEDLPEGLPVTEMGNLGSLDDALKASDYPEGWLTAGERRRIKKAQAAYADGVVGDVEPGEIIREA
jgi:hypothetical protein